MSTSAASSLLSTRKESASALDEVLEGADSLSRPPPQLAVLFTTPHHRDAFESMAGAIGESIAPQAVIGCTAEGVIGGGVEVEEGPGLVLFLVWLPGLRCEEFVADFQPATEGGTVRGVPLERLGEEPAEGVLLLADPFSFPTDALLAAVDERAPGTPFLGGIASGGSFPGKNRLLSSRGVADRGAVGVVLRDVDVGPLVSQGCRPVGRHYVVTRGRENVIEALGGRPAVEVLRQVFTELDEHDQELLGGHVHIGRVIDEYKSRFGPGDFLVRSIIGLDPERGTLEMNDLIRVGQTVQFHVRDPESATRDLELLLAERGAWFERAKPPAALLFSCNGRGTRMFTTANHDVEALRRHCPQTAVAGFFAAGEIGPVGGRNFLHGFTASIGFLAPR